MVGHITFDAFLTRLGAAATTRAQERRLTASTKTVNDAVKYSLFTDAVPTKNDWDNENLRQLNHTIHAVVNSPLDWEAVERVVQIDIFSEDMIESLDNRGVTSDFPQLLKYAFEWQFNRLPEEGVFPATLEEWLEVWRNRKVRRIDEDADDEDLEEAFRPLVERWLECEPADFDEHDHPDNITHDVPAEVVAARQEEISATKKKGSGRGKTPRGSKTSGDVSRSTKTSGKAKAGDSAVQRHRRLCPARERCERCVRRGVKECVLGTGRKTCDECKRLKQKCTFGGADASGASGDAAGHKSQSIEPAGNPGEDASQHGPDKAESSRSGGRSAGKRRADTDEEPMNPAKRRKPDEEELARMWEHMQALEGRVVELEAIVARKDAADAAQASISGPAAGAAPLPASADRAGPAPPSAIEGGVEPAPAPANGNGTGMTPPTTSEDGAEPAPPPADGNGARSAPPPSGENGAGSSPSSANEDGTGAGPAAADKLAPTDSTYERLAGPDPGITVTALGSELHRIRRLTGGFTRRALLPIRTTLHGRGTHQNTWDDETLRITNVTIRAAVDSPLDWEAVEHILQADIFGVFPATLEEWLDVWRNRGVRKIAEDADETELEAAFRPLVDRWLANDRFLEPQSHGAQEVVAARMKEKEQEEKPAPKKRSGRGSASQTSKTPGNAEAGSTRGATAPKDVPGQATGADASGASGDAAGHKSQSMEPAGNPGEDASQHGPDKAESSRSGGRSAGKRRADTDEEPMNPAKRRKPDEEELARMWEHMQALEGRVVELEAIRRPCWPRPPSAIEGDVEPAPPPANGNSSGSVPPPTSGQSVEPVPPPAIGNTVGPAPLFATEGGAGGGPPSTTEGGGEPIPPPADREVGPAPPSASMDGNGCTPASSPKV
ncbi:uncharacterized protein B0H18DRAFT_961549 [Fomitopsis serialis]|uniref:uncharacterized protein n=1 Tax=Fomitopsis serialis TaxID=139415 RepID=UPI0020072942|nr:uncharacterized protein B0H18DRAFT_961549 [Neoantrodia serialis]KAH9911910.1 hypothetical protein B0H18DRAFT_961549 [Neoantrodia serialis]